MNILSSEQVRALLKAHLAEHYDNDKSRAAKAWGTCPEVICKVLYDSATPTPAMRRAIGASRVTVYVEDSPERHPWCQRKT